MSLGRIVKSRPLSRFADLAHLSERDLLRVFVVSPWVVSDEDSDYGPLVRLLSSVRSAGARLSVLTRTPDKASHLHAVEMCVKMPQSEVLYLDSLHAKLYLLESNGLRAAMIGSPNFTPQGDRMHRELAVEVRSIKDSDAGAMLVQDLFLFARELMSDSTARFRKRFGDRIA